MQSHFTAPLTSINRDSRLRPLRLSILVLALLVVLTVFNPAKAEVYDQDQVKAVFLYNLTNFITWPAKTDGTDIKAFTIGVIGSDTPMAAFLEHAVSGETARGLSIAVTHFRSLDEIESHPCDLLFIDGDQMHLWPQIRAIARRHKILTVSDVEGFGRRGGIVGLLD